MSTHAAGYMGGHPDTPKPEEEGFLRVDDHGLRYEVTSMANFMAQTKTVVDLPHADLRGISAADGKLKRGGGGMALALGGVAGYAVHKRKRGRESHPLLVLAEQGGRFMTIRFATSTDAALAIISTLNDSRRNAGLEPLDSAG